MKNFEIEVWFRFVSFGEQEKDFQHHVIEALNVSEAVNKAKSLYKSLTAIPFAYYCEGVKLTPNE